MKIKRPPKKTPSSNPQIAAFISSLASAQDDDLPELLESVLAVGWTWPRTDLQHWINTLNKFDTILEGVITDYDLATLEHPQTNQFTPRTKRALLAILKFEKLLLENSTNRKIFASFDVSSPSRVCGLVGRPSSKARPSFTARTPQTRANPTDDRLERWPTC